MDDKDQRARTVRQLSAEAVSRFFGIPREVIERADAETPPGKRVDITHLLVGRTVIGPGRPARAGGQRPGMDDPSTAPAAAAKSRNE